ncbi:HDOD domain-containing protein [Parashewanella spongiae]|uniref:HDOD domain-containing protein n=1 Tax=Parashewanella spongiae TaxID=342950 RepID=A0A3A6TFL2_9GAMM|nr:HDOD domain-containing protein [Parashewanella spongiae]MCL1079229.1 HDOD domain-containing protein [Parashewanella spongiae]RJY07882.1 HDOD domain-containing protein [Parashewanella spongiae]
MTDLEQTVFTQVKNIIANEEQVIGRRGVFIPLKKAIIADGDIQNVIDIIASDPAIAAHLLWRTNSANAGSSSLKKPKTLKEALIRLGQVNIYRYTFTFYLKEHFDELPQPYQRLVKGYWQLTEDIAEEAINLLHEKGELSLDVDELQTLALFSVFGQVIALTAFAYLEQELQQSIPLTIVKKLIDEQQQTFTLDAFKALKLDDELESEFLIAHNLRQSENEHSVGLILRNILDNRNILINPI